METPTIWGLNNSHRLFERVEQMLITLLKTPEYMIINVQAVRIESHKQLLQIVGKYSKKWQKNDDLN